MTHITKETINDFIAHNNPRALTQTGYWLNIEKLGEQKTYIVYTSEKGKITSSVLLIKHDLTMNKNYFYAPYGPVISKELTPPEIQATTQKLLHEIKKFIDLTNTIFIRFEPFYQTCHTLYHSLAENGFVATNRYTQPKDTLILNLLQSKDEIFKNFKQKTRYNIRLAHKKHIKIIKTSDVKDVDYFFELLLKTCDRNTFRPHNKRHYQNILKTLGPKNIVFLYHAQYKDKIIASIMVSYFGHIATYLHGASSNTYRNLMPTYALQWQAIQDAIDYKCRFYDFGGIAPPGSKPNHPWAGITRFKNGFGGIEVSTAGHMEKTISPFWHTVYKTAKFLQQS